MRELLQPARDQQEQRQASALTLPETTCVHCASPVSINGPILVLDFCDRTVLKALLNQNEVNPDIQQNSRRCIVALLIALSEELLDVLLFTPLDIIAHFLRIQVKTLSVVTSRRRWTHPQAGACAEGLQDSLAHTRERAVRCVLGPPAFILHNPVAAPSTGRPGGCWRSRR